MLFYRLTFIRIVKLLTLLVLGNQWAYANAEFNFTAGNELRGQLLSELGFTDNFLFTSTENQATSFLNISPSVYAQTQFGQSMLRLTAEVSHYKFNNFSSDDHSDFVISPEFHYKFSHNKAIYFAGQTEGSYEYRGTGLSRGDATLLKEGDQKRDSLVRMGYLYGSVDSVAKLKFEFGQQQFRYNTRRPLTRTLDSETLFVNSSFDYLLSGKSYIGLDLHYSDIKHPFNDDINEKRWSSLVGLKWKTTEITEYELLLGYQQIKFADQVLNDDRTFKWRAGLFWQPTEFTELGFSSERDFEQANTITNSYRVVDKYNLRIKTALTDTVDLFTSIGYQQQAIIFATRSDHDNYFSANVGVDYQQNRWLTVTVNYRFNQLASSIANFDSQAQGLSLGLKVSL